MFSNKPINIDKSTRDYAIRISNINPNEMFCISKWDFSAKSIEENNGTGIYGMSMSLFICGFDWFFRILISCCHNIENIRIVILEIDKNDIIQNDSFNELSMRRANILKTLTIDEFINLTRKIPLFDHQHIEEMANISIKASKYYALGQKEDWLKQMEISYLQMYQKLERGFEKQKAMLDNARKINNRERYELLYDKMKENQYCRQHITNEQISILWNKL